MRFESQIPGEATKGFSVISAEVPYTECLKGRKLWEECVAETRRELLRSIILQYREASSVKRKSKLLDAFTVTTGYNRKYAIWLLNHAKEEPSPSQHPRPRRYGSDVQNALFLVWHAANRICAKRLIPFLPTLIENLERHEHLQISEECRRKLLSMSAAPLSRTLSALTNPHLAARDAASIRAYPARKPGRSSGRKK